jgi:hypothetical protein
MPMMIPASSEPTLGITSSSPAIRESARAYGKPRITAVIPQLNPLGLRSSASKGGERSRLDPKPCVQLCVELPTSLRTESTSVCLSDACSPSGPPSARASRAGRPSPLRPARTVSRVYKQNRYNRQRFCCIGATGVEPATFSAPAIRDQTAAGRAADPPLSAFLSGYNGDTVFTPLKRKPRFAGLSYGPGRTRTSDLRIMSYVSGVEPGSAETVFGAWKCPSTL